MSVTFGLLLSFIALCVTTGAVIAWMVLRPQPKTVESYRMPVSRTVVATDFGEGRANPVEGYRDLFEQFDITMHETELGLEPRRPHQREIIFSLQSIDDSTTFIASDDVYDVDTITRSELSVLRSQLGL